MISAALQCHGSTRCDLVRSIEARVDRSGTSLRASYAISGEIARLRIAAPGKPRVAGRLWQHTCCEIFIARKAASAYHEFNFAPSGEWAAYAFAGYRDGAPLADMTLDPQITVRRTPDKLELEASIALERLSLAHAALSLGLSAVIEDDRGELSYWALEHAPGKPDFHYREAFVLELDEARN